MYPANAQRHNKQYSIEPSLPEMLCTTNYYTCCVIYSDLNVTV